MDRIRNAYGLARSSWHLLRQDRELAWLPVLGAVASLLLAVALLGPAMAIFSGSGGDSIPVAGYILGFIAWVAVSTVSMLSRAAIIHGANTRMEGGDPTVSTSLRGAMAHWPSVAGYAAVAVTVGLVLDMIRERAGLLGDIVAFLGDTAWRVLTYLVLPVIVIEGVGAVDGIKQSSNLVKRTWGEQVTANVGFGLLSLAAIAPAVILAIVLAPVPVIGILAVVAAVVWAIGVSVTVSALTGIFQTALYRQATGRSVPEVFDARQLRGAITPR